MNSRKIKNKIAKNCKGNMEQYFNMVEILNLLILEKKINLSEIDVFNKVNMIYSKKYIESQC